MRGVANIPRTAGGGTGFENYPGSGMYNGSVGTRTTVTATGQSKADREKKKYYKGSSGNHNLGAGSPKSSQPSSSEDEGFSANLNRNQIGVERTVTTEHLTRDEMMRQASSERERNSESDPFGSKERIVSPNTRRPEDDSAPISGYEYFMGDEEDEYHRVRGLERDRGNSHGDPEIGIPMRPMRTVSRRGVYR